MMPGDLARITEEIRQYALARAGEVVHRISPEGRRQRLRERARRRRAAIRIARRLVLAIVAIAIVVFGWGLFVGPIGIMGALAAVIAMAIAGVVILSMARAPEPTPQALAASDLPLLPQRTEEWLIRQRPALPAPAMRLVDTIGLQLEALQPQLLTIDPQAPTAREFRKLVAEELPELIQGYTRVPAALRGGDRGGGSAPDRQLVDGLAIVTSELDRMSGTLASGDLDRVATQARYLELKYKGAAEDGA